MIDYEQEILKGGYNRIIKFAENILLRPNDHKLLMGEEKFNAVKQALESVLENYKHDEIYKYYYELNNQPHGFCDFKRWKNGLLF